MPDTSFPALLGFGLPASPAVPLHRLGPARVTAVLPSMLEVEADGATSLATMAVAGLYTPAVGDSVLLIEAQGLAYVIGVLHATGPMTITAPADLRLQAPYGAIVLEAAVVRTRAAEVQVEAGLLQVAVDRLLERARTARRVVAESLEVEAGTLRTRVRECYTLLARRLRAEAEEDVKIDGKRIHLG